MKKKLFIGILITLLVIGLACTNKGKQSIEKVNQSTQNTKHLQEVIEKKAKQPDLSLKEIMLDLAFQINRIEYGILTNNRYMIEQGAKAIANHPIPKGGIKPYLRKNMNMIKLKIPEMDKNIHQTAIKISESVQTLTMLEVQKMTDTIMKSCVTCHNHFRD